MLLQEEPDQVVVNVIDATNGGQPQAPCIKVNTMCL